MNSYILAGLLATLLCSVASFIQGVSGIGFSMFLMSTLPLATTYTLASNMNRTVGLVLPIVTIWRYKDYINFKPVLTTSIASLIMGTVGINLLASVSSTIMQPICGVFLILLVCLSVFLDKKEIRFTPSFTKGLIFGGLAGLAYGALNITGPVLAIYYMRLSDKTEEFRAAINVNFLILAAWVNIYYQWKIGYTTQELEYSVPAIIGSVVATLVALRFFGDMDKKKVSKILYAVILVMSSVMLIKTFLG